MAVYLNNDGTIRLLGNKKNLWKARIDPEAEGQKGKIKTGQNRKNEVRPEKARLNCKRRG